MRTRFIFPNLNIYKENFTMNKMSYMDVMKQDFLKDFAEDDLFTAALLDLCKNTKENDE